MNKPEVDGMQGCTDGGCIFGHPGGMHTNGGCACVKELRMEPEMRMRFIRNIRLLREKVRHLREELERSHKT